MGLPQQELFIGLVRGTAEEFVLVPGHRLLPHLEFQFGLGPHDVGAVPFHGQSIVLPLDLEDLLAFGEKTARREFRADLDDLSVDARRQLHAPRRNDRSPGLHRNA